MRLDWNSPMLHTDLPFDVPPVPAGLIGRQVIIPIKIKGGVERRAWRESFEHAQRITSAREEWPWPARISDVQVLSSLSPYGGGKGEESSRPFRPTNG